MNSEVMFSSKNMNWTTPQAFFERLDAEFGFTLDVAATKENAKCFKYYTLFENGLIQSWQGEIVFCNPPYGRSIGQWICKAYQESRFNPFPIVLLIPARSDTAYWHDYIMKADEIWFIRGRLKFGNAKNSAPFPSVVVVFRSPIDAKYPEGPRCSSY